MWVTIRLRRGVYSVVRGLGQVAGIWVSGLVSADGGPAFGGAGVKSGSGGDGVDLSHPAIRPTAVSRMKSFIKDRNFIWSIAIIGFQHYTICYQKSIEIFSNMRHIS
jgi:hypothetical protein